MRKGFTLIELLVVIAIIGVLASVVLASLNSARERSRDAARVAQLKEIQKALELFYSDNGRYPTEGAPDNANGQICSSCSGNINTILRTYMGGVPQDPINASGHAFYYDGMHACGGHPVQSVVAAVTLENTANGNQNGTKCSSWGGAYGIGTTGSYMIVLGNSSG